MKMASALKNIYRMCHKKCGRPTFDPTQNSVYTSFVGAGILDSSLIKVFYIHSTVSPTDTVLLFCKLIFEYPKHILCLLFKLRPEIIDTERYIFHAFIGIAFSGPL